MTLGFCESGRSLGNLHFFHAPRSPWWLPLSPAALEPFAHPVQSSAFFLPFPGVLCREYWILVRQAASQCAASQHAALAPGRTRSQRSFCSVSEAVSTPPGTCWGPACCAGGQLAAKPWAQNLLLVTPAGPGSAEGRGLAQRECGGEYNVGLQAGDRGSPGQGSEHA